MTWITQLTAIRDDRAHVPALTRGRRIGCTAAFHATSVGPGRREPVRFRTCLNANSYHNAISGTMTNPMTNVNAPRICRSIRPLDWGRRPIPIRSRHRQIPCARAATLSIPTTGEAGNVAPQLVDGPAGPTVSACRPPDQRPRVPPTTHSQSSRHEPNGSRPWVNPWPSFASAAVLARAPR